MSDLITMHDAVLIDLDGVLFVKHMAVTVEEKTIASVEAAIVEYIEALLSTVPHAEGSAVFHMTAPGSPKGGRYDIYPDYKQRADNRTELHKEHIGVLIRNKELLGYPVEVTHTFEADDTICAAAVKADNPVIITADKDLQQVCGLFINYAGDKVVVDDPVGYLQKAGNKYTFCGATGFLFQAIAGDAADSIPSVKLPVELRAILSPTIAQTKALAAGKALTGKPMGGPGWAYKMCVHAARKDKSIYETLAYIANFDDATREQVSRNTRLVYMQAGASFVEYMRGTCSANPVIKQ